MENLLYFILGVLIGIIMLSIMMVLDKDTDYWSRQCAKIIKPLRKKTIFEKKKREKAQQEKRYYKSLIRSIKNDLFPAIEKEFSENESLFDYLRVEFTDSWIKKNLSITINEESDKPVYNYINSIYTKKYWGEIATLWNKEREVPYMHLSESTIYFNFYFARTKETFTFE